MRRLAWCFAAALLIPAGVGCASARLVSIDREGGVIAVPSRSPRHLRKAEALMAKESPSGFEIVKEAEQVVGTIEQVQTNTDTTGSPVLSALHIAPVSQQTTETRSFEDRKEWWIWFRKK